MVARWFPWIMYAIIAGTCSMLIWDEIAIGMEWLLRERKFPMWERIENTFSALEILSFASPFGFGVLCLEPLHRYSSAIVFFSAGCILLSVRMIVT